MRVSLCPFTHPHKPSTLYPKPLQGAGIRFSPGTSRRQGLNSDLLPLKSEFSPLFRDREKEEPESVLIKWKEKQWQTQEPLKAKPLILVGRGEGGEREKGERERVWTKSSRRSSSVPDIH